MKDGELRTVPQWQRSKGSLILTAALELSTNHVTYLYSKKKDTEEMLKLLEILLGKYSSESCIYLSWDAASWVTPAEKAAIAEKAAAHSMSASRYLRALGLALPIQSTIDHRAVLDLLKINADLGRLGGLIKMWLSSNDTRESSNGQAMERKLDGTLKEIRSLQKKLSDRIQDL